MWLYTIEASSKYLYQNQEIFYKHTDGFWSIIQGYCYKPLAASLSQYYIICLPIFSATVGRIVAYFKATKTSGYINQSCWVHLFVGCKREGIRFMDSDTFIAQYRHFVRWYYFSPWHLPPFRGALFLCIFVTVEKLLTVSDIIAFLVAESLAVYLDMPILRTLSVMLLLPLAFQLYVNQMVWHKMMARDRMAMSLLPWKMDKLLVCDASCVDTLALSHLSLE